MIGWLEIIIFAAVILLLQFFIIKAAVKTAIEEVLEDATLKKAREEKDQEDR